MRCASCGSESDTTRKFCGECGAALPKSCASCGAESPPGFKFCGECGASLGEPSARAPVTPKAAERDPRAYTPKHLAEKILASKSALEGERKQVTVLFADVKSSMELAESVDPEEWHRILDRFFQILADGVHRFEGTINQYTGDGIMALFGAPIAHEDHAQRACYAALHLRDELRRYADALRVERGLSFLVRLGLNSGDVVVGKIGDDLRMDYTAQGPVVGIAQRMEQLAEPGTVCVAEGTAALVAGWFELRDLGPLTVRGLGAPLRVAVLESVGPHRTRLDVSRTRGLSRFVGRADEMATLEAALAHALGGRGQVVGIVAEAGTGKSRLCLEFSERCQARGIRVGFAHGVSHGKAIPLLPILESFRDYFGVSERDSAQAAREKIAGRLLLLDRGFDDSLPLFFDFMGVPDPAAPPPAVQGEARQRQLFAIVQRLVRARSARESFVLVFEDLHWIDAASEAFLEKIVEFAAGTRTLVVTNTRPEYKSPWGGRSHVQQIALLPLSAAELDALLAELLGPEVAASGLPARIRERTGGNPFFAEEVVASLAESGALTGPKGRYRLAAPVERITVPGTVQSVLAARIDRLAEREKQVLQTASVIGKEFGESILRAVVVLPERDLAEALSRLVQAELIYEEALYPEAEYAFKHPLTRDVAYGAQLGEKRTRVHARVARALEEDTPERADERAALLAHHCEAAGEALAAARWHDRAAHWARRADVAEARQHWERVRSLAGGLPESIESAALVASACAQLLFAGSRLGLSEAEATALFEEGRARAAGAASPRLQVMLLFDYARWRITALGTPDALLELGREAQRIARSAGDREALVMATFSLGLGCWMEQRIPEALALMDEILELTAGDARLGTDTLGYSLLAFALIVRATLRAWSGRFDTLEADADRAASLAAEQSSLDFSGQLHLYPALAEEARGDAARTAAHARALFALRERAVSVLVDQFTDAALGTALLLEGQWARAAETLERLLADIQARRFGRWVEALALDRLAEALLGTGDLAAAEARAREAREVARTRHTRLGYRGPALLARIVARTRGRSARAEVEQLLEESAAYIEETGARAWVPLVHEARAELERACGDAAAAERELAEAQRLYADMGATGHAQRLSRELGLVR